MVRSILIILVLVTIGTLAVGSYFQYQNEQSTKPSPTPSPFAVSINKSNPKKGEILVVFKADATSAQIADIFSSHDISQYDIIDKGLMLYRAQVPSGQEQTTVDLLLVVPQVNTATLSYN